MGAQAQLSQSTVEVEPGRSATLSVTVRNNGTVVDRYSFEALGEAAPWVTFSPASLSLFPEASGTVNIILSPPRQHTVHAGPTPLGVRVASAEDAIGSVVEEATVDVAAFSDITLELVPRVARGRVTARAQLAVDNRSNCSYRAGLAGSDPQMLLGFKFRPPVVDVAPGNAEFVKVAIRPSKRFWRGPERTRTFRLILRDEQAPPDEVGVLAGSEPPSGIAGVDAPSPSDRGAGRSETGVRGGSAARFDPPPDASAAGRAARAATPAGSGPPAAGAGMAAAPVAGPAAGPGGPVETTTEPVPTAPRGRPAPVPSPHKEEIFADGSMLQEPMLPRWLVAAAGALLALLLLAVLLWFTLFKPQIRSTAQNEVNKQLTANGITPVSTGSGTKSGSGAGGSSGSGAGGGSGGGSSTATTVAGGGGSTTVGAGTTVNGGTTATGNGTKVVFTVPGGRTLQVTDILVENSAGDTGNLALARNGTIVMQWSMANFRDLDYHWITPTVFSPGTQMQLVVSGCTGACTPGIYFAGHMASP